MRKPRSPFLLPPGECRVTAMAGPRRSHRLERPAPLAAGVIFRHACAGPVLRLRRRLFGEHDRRRSSARATIELRRSVFALQQPQRFEVIFYNTESIPMPGGPRPRTADLQAKNQLLSWLRLIEPDGGTDPRPAMKQALALRPDAVFLLSDGAFPDGTVDEVAKLNTRKIPIHCVDVTGGLAGDHLQRIAAASGGQYASRPGDLQARP